MATKPLTINAGLIEQLSDGQGLDVGGWNLPTSGGTENYVLIANSSGHAVWSSTLILTALDVDNISIDGNTISSDTGIILLDDMTGINGELNAHYISLGYGGIRFEHLGNGIEAYSSLDLNYNSDATVTGTLAIDLAREAFTGTFLVKIWGHTDDGTTSNMWEVTIGAYGDWDDGWRDGHATVIGNPPFKKVRLCDNSDVIPGKRACILLGETSTEWKYPKFEIARLLVLGGHSDWVEDDWVADYHTSEATFTDIITCTWNQDVPGPTVSGKVLTSTGDKTTAWTTDITGLTSLTVDNITINGAVITSDTGAISFSNENLSTSGTVVGSNIPSPTVDDQVLVSTASGVAGWQTAGNNQYLASDGSGEVAWIAKPVLASNPTADDQVLISTGAGAASWSTASTNQVLASDGAGEVAWTNKSFGDSIPANSAANEIYVGTGAGTAAWTTDLAGLTSLTVDNITINGAVISSDTGTISFSDEDLTTTGDISGDTLVLTNAARHTGGSGANAYTCMISHGSTSNPQTGTCVIDLPVAFTNTMMAIKLQGFNYSSESAWEVLIGGYNYNGATKSWPRARAAVSGKTLFTKIRLGYNGNTGKSCIMLGETDTSWTYPKIQVSAMLAAHSVEGSYASGWAIAYYTDETNFYNNDPPYSDPGIIDWNQDFASPASSGQVLVATGEKTASWSTELAALTFLKVDNITINGAVISSDTGAINFSNENLSTTGTMVGSNIPSPSVDDQVLISTASGVASWSTAGNDQYLASNGSGEAAWANKPAAMANPTADNQLLESTGSGTAAWTDTLDILKVDNITINGAVISSDTGAISFSNENLTSTGTIVGKNIPSPSTSGKALVSTAAGTGTWYTTCLYDVLKIEVPSASGSERKFVLTADPGSQLEIEPAPWPLTLFANETIYVRTTGNDSTGDGSASFPFLTLTKTIQYLGGLYIGDYTVTVDIGEGVFTETGTLTFMHPFGSQVTFQGVSERIDDVDTTGISGTTSYGHNNLYYRNVTMILPVGKSVSVGDYIGIAAATGGTNPNALVGVHKVSAWVGGSRTATLQVSYRNGSETPSGTITCDIDLIKSVIAFSNKNGMKISGPFYGGNWRGLVIQGNYNGSNSSLYGIWALNGAVVAVSNADTSGFACGVWGFKINLYAQNNALIFADYAYASKAGQHGCSAQNGGIFGLRYARVSATNNYGIYAFNGSTIAAQYVTVVGTGDNSIMSYQGSFIDLRSAFVGESNSTTSIHADRWAAIDGTAATVDDAISPTVDGNNDGSYVIGL